MKPFAEAAELYRRAGWPGTIPLPAGAKSPPPDGWTGRSAPYPSGADVAAWCDSPHGAGNIGLRLADGVIGIDVDAYEGKPGGKTLAGLQAQLGQLPATWVSIGRAEGSSGIRFFRTPTGLHWPGKAGPGIEVIQAAHRYAVVWPSVHPSGVTYFWENPDHVVMIESYEIPRAAELPELPAAWIEHLTGLVRREPVIGAELSDWQAEQWLGACRAGPACPVVEREADRAVAGLSSPGATGSRHELMLDSSRTLAAYGGEGHAGAGPALARLRDAFLNAVGGERDASGEWQRALAGAVRLAAAANPSPRQECSCALLGGAGLDFSEGWGFIGTGVHQAGEQAGDQENGGEGGGGGEGGEDDWLDRFVLSTAQMRSHPPPAPLIEGILTLDSESWLIGRSGAFKSFIAVDLAGHVVTGKPWMGHQTTRGNVLYLVAEGTGGMGPRIRAWEQRNGQLPEPGVLWLPRPLQVRREDHWNALLSWCRRRRPVLVILDTQARISVGMNENDNTEMGELIDAIGRLRRSCGACVLVVHHLGRSGVDARGASAIDGAQDTELKVTRLGEGEDRRVELRTDKQRHLRDDVTIELELFPCVLDGGGDSLVVGSPLGAVTRGPDWRANLTVNQAHLVQVMIDIFPLVGATKSELMAETLKRPVRQLDGTSRIFGSRREWDSSFRRAWDVLVSSGRFVKIHGVQRYMIDNPPAAPADTVGGTSDV